MTKTWGHRRYYNSILVNNFLANTNIASWRGIKSNRWHS